jgi:hypothetical protein
MKAELLKRIFKIQRDKLDLCLELLEQISTIFRDNVETLPDNVKESYIEVVRPFMEQYTILSGEVGTYEEKEN